MNKSLIFLSLVKLFKETVVLKSDTTCRETIQRRRVFLYFLIQRFCSPDLHKILLSCGDVLLLTKVSKSTTLHYLHVYYVVIFPAVAKK